MRTREYFKTWPKEQRRDYFKRLGELRSEGFTRWRHGQNMEQWLDTLPPEFRDPSSDSMGWVWLAFSLLTAGAGIAAQIRGYMNLATILWVAWWAIFATITLATWVSILSRVSPPSKKDAAAILVLYFSLTPGFLSCISTRFPSLFQPSHVVLWRWWAFMIESLTNSVLFDVLSIYRIQLSNVTTRTFWASSIVYVIRVVNFGLLVQMAFALSRLRTASRLNRTQPLRVFRPTRKFGSVTP